mmetsp:Transcript_26416/g.77020  ORF Transcript_26416/g.77020 Transcript_26416/m.77020 type:complete len:214 (+) Transcript_26416:315-956(+)
MSLWRMAETRSSSSPTFGCGKTRRPYPGASSKLTNSGTKFTPWRSGQDPNREYLSLAPLIREAHAPWRLLHLRNQNDLPQRRTPELRLTFLLLMAHLLEQVHHYHHYHPQEASTHSFGQRMWCHSRWQVAWSATRSRPPSGLRVIHKQSQAHCPRRHIRARWRPAWKTIVLTFMPSLKVYIPSPRPSLRPLLHWQQLSSRRLGALKTEPPWTL